MNRRNFFLLMLGNLAWLLLPGCGKVSHSQPRAERPHPAPAAPQTKELDAYEQENQRRLQAAKQRAKERQRLSQAVAKTPEYRARLQYEKQGVWAALLNKYRPTFMRLRAQAAQSSTHYVRCTICQGTGQLNVCVICNSTGICPTCKGTGRLEDNSICPTCQGNGKCFLCAGTGKMIDPFCNDGLVYDNQIFPPNQIPVST